MTNPGAREFALERLGTSAADTRFGRTYFPQEISARSGCSLSQAYEARWGLVSDGLAYIDQRGQSGPDEWDWRATAAGLAAGRDGQWEPRDPTGFLNRLRPQIPDIDPVALLYMEEALRAFGAPCFLASSVMLGVAAEQVFTGLARAVVASVGNRGVRLGVALDSAKSSQNARFNELRKVLEPLPEERARRATAFRPDRRVWVEIIEP